MTARCTLNMLSLAAVLLEAAATVRLDDFVLAHSPYAMPVVRPLCVLFRSQFLNDVCPCL